MSIDGEKEGEFKITKEDHIENDKSQAWQLVNSSIYLERPSNRIKLLTQNMFLLPNIPQFGFNLYKDQRMMEFAKTILPQFDITCCQEVFYTLNARKD